MRRLRGHWDDKHDDGDVCIEDQRGFKDIFKICVSSVCAGGGVI